MKPSYRTPFEGLILRDGQTKDSRMPSRRYWHRWTRSDDTTTAPPVFTSASHPLEIAFLSRAGVPDVAAIRSDKICLVTLCTDEELARDSPGFQRRVEAEVACREHYPIQDKRRPDNIQAFDALIQRLVDRIEREDMRVIVHCNGGKGRSALVAAAVLIG